MISQPVTLISQASSSQLIIVDVQERLATAMAPEPMQAVIRRCQMLLQAAGLLGVPALYTEQYPRGLGTTCAPLLPMLEPHQRIEKMTFSCCDEPGFMQKLDNDRPQVMLAGMEAHICVLQTALALQARGWQVFVIADAVIARALANRRNALARLRQAGVIVSNTESLLFEWLGKAGGDSFRQISKLIR